MAVVDYFLKLDGIKGESKDSKHKDEIDVTSFSWGATQSHSAGTGGGLGAGKVTIHDLVITKSVDKSSTDLMLSCCNGKHIKDGLITVRKAGENPLEYLKIKLTDVLVSSVQFSGNGTGGQEMESITIVPGKFQIEYQEQKADGSGSPAGNMGWDVKANAKL